MQEIFSVALSSMEQDIERLNRVASNLANVATPGYKREVAAMQSFAQALDTLRSSQVPTVVGSGGGIATAPTVQVAVDMRPGAIKLTSEPLDLAIVGEGFFEVATDSGPAYTRQGNFRIDAQGRLVTAQGHAVMGSEGDIYLTTRNPVIDAAGNITEPASTSGLSANTPNTPIAKLKIVRFDDTRSMQRLGHGMFSAGSGMKFDMDTAVQVRQGAQENANVNPMQEMVQLIQTMRHFESMQKIAQGYDAMLGTAIHKLGDLS